MNRRALRAWVMACLLLVLPFGSALSAQASQLTPHSIVKGLGSSEQILGPSGQILRLRGGSGLAKWLSDDVGDMLKTSNENPKALPKKLTVPGKHFTYESDFDTKGILYHIGTNLGNSSNWQNPHNSKLVTVTMESIAYSACPSAAVSRSKARLRSKARKNSWMMLDLGEGRYCKPNYYTLRHGGHADEPPLRDWELQASVDGKEWDTLRVHTQDSALKGEYGTHSWEITSAKKAYRYFRVFVTAKAAFQLSIGGFELYGELRSDTDTNEA